MRGDGFGISEMSADNDPRLALSDPECLVWSSYSVGCDGGEVSGERID